MRLVIKSSSQSFCFLQEVMKLFLFRPSLNFRHVAYSSQLRERLEWVSEVQANLGGQIHVTFSQKRICFWINQQVWWHWTSFPPKRPLKQKRSHCIPSVLTYNPASPYLNKIITKHLPMLQSSNRCKEAFSERPFIAYRRPRNLRDLLVKGNKQRHLLQRHLP